MLLPEVLQRPLVFGDQQQIHALRMLQEKQDYEALPDCVNCDGEGKVMAECVECEGEGKDAEALSQHWEKYPSSFL